MPSFDQTWLPYIYLYGVGGFFFLIGMFIIRKSGAVNMQKKRHRYWWNILIFGFIYFMIFHAVLIITALYF